MYRSRVYKFMRSHKLSTLLFYDIGDFVSYITKTLQEIHTDVKGKASDVQSSQALKD